MAESPLSSSAQSAVEESAPNLLERTRRVLFRATTRDPLLWVALASIIGILLIDATNRTPATPGIAALALLTILIALARPKALWMLIASGLGRQREAWPKRLNRHPAVCDFCWIFSNSSVG